MGLGAQEITAVEVAVKEESRPRHYVECREKQCHPVAETLCARGNLAGYFRDQIRKCDFPFEIISDSLPNAVTPLSPTNGVSAYDIFTVLKDEYRIWVCPNGGEFKDKVFRVGHIGALETRDYDVLLEALKDMCRRRFI